LTLLSGMGAVREVIALAVAALVACTSVAQPAVTTPVPTVTATATPTPILAAVPLQPAVFAGPVERQLATGSCGRSALFEGGPNEALISATGHNVPPTVYAIADPPHAAAFLFDQPLISDRSNKILWVVGTPRTGPLTIIARPVDASEPTVHFSLEPNASPGEIYPSGIEVPFAGCWRFTLEWRDLSVSMDLLYSPP
jgi:hypothetical protein